MSVNSFLLSIVFSLCAIHVSSYPFLIYISFALLIASSGFTISSNLSLPTCANHLLKGSAFGDGIVCIILNNVFVSATSVNLIFPSFANIFNCPIFSDTSTNPSKISFCFKSLQYFLGLLLFSTKASITSTTEKYQSSLYHSLLISFSSNIANLFSCITPHPCLFFAII